MAARAAVTLAVSQLFIGLLLVGIAERGLGAPAAAAAPQAPLTKPAADPFGENSKPAVAGPLAAKIDAPERNDPHRGDAKSKSTRADGAQVIRLAEPAKGRPAGGAAIAAGPLTDDAIRQVLARRVTIDVEGIRLDDMVARLAKISGINIVLDTPALEEADVHSDRLVTIAVKNLTLRSALDLALLKVDPSPTKPVLTWSVEDEVLTITTKEAAEQHLFTKVYAVEDFAERTEPGRKIRHVYANGGPYDRDSDDLADLADLIGVIKDLVDPDSWKDSGGPAEAKVAGGSIVASQVWRNHQDIAALLESLRAIRTAQKKHPGGELRRVAEGRLAEAESYAQIRSALARPINLDFKERALADAIGDLAKKSGIPITIEQSALEECDVAADAPVTIAVKNVPLRRALELLLQKVDPSPIKPVLTWSIDDEVLTITTKEAAEQHLAFVVYPVLDLIEPDAESGLDTDDADSLMNVLKETIDPDSWKENGGPAQVLYLRSCGALVVSQIESNHTAIEKLFGDLRRTLPPPGRRAHQEHADSVCVVVYHLKMAWKQAAPAQTKAPEPPAAPAPAPAQTPAPGAAPAPAKPAGAAGAAAAVPGGASSGQILAGFGGPSTDATVQESVNPNELTPRDADELKAVVVEQVGADQWPAGTSIHRVANSLIVRQKASVQRNIIQFLKELNVLQSQSMGGGFGGGGAGFISGPTPVVGSAGPSQ